MSSGADARVTKKNWQIICQCQQHPSVARALVQFQQLRGPVAALLVSSSFLLLGMTFPIEAMSVNALPLKLTLPSGVKQSAESSSTTGTGTDRGALHLVTNKLKNEFFNPAGDEKQLISERIKEEFFRTEVPFGAIIYREAKKNGLAPELVAAIVETESDFRPKLLSSKNAHGLMQLMPTTGALMGASDLLNPAENVQAGAKYLRYLQRRFEQEEMMLAAYNAGEFTVRRYGGIPPYKETQNFVKKVARNHQLYQQRVAKRVAVAENLRSALAQ